MENRDWAAYLRECYKSRCKREQRIRLPSHVSFRGTHSEITISMPATTVTMNMQTDDAAFEGWATVFKVWTGVDRVKLEWELPKIATAEEGCLHYQRFLYRVQKYATCFPGWFEIITKEPRADLLISQSKRYFVNSGRLSRRNDRKDCEGNPHQMTEDVLENTITQCNEIRERLERTIRVNRVRRQLPVGVFEGKVSATTYHFPGGKSAIDLWGVGDDGKLVLMELKKKGNNKVGSISELFFYSMLVNDIQNGQINYEDTENDEASTIIPHSHGVRAYILAPTIHPLLELIDQNVFDRLTEGVSTTGANMEFGMVKIEENFQFVMEHPKHHRIY